MRMIHTGMKGGLSSAVRSPAIFAAPAARSSRAAVAAVSSGEGQGKRVWLVGLPSSAACQAPASVPASAST